MDDEASGEAEGCRPWPEQEEGPYHRDVGSSRQDIVEDRAGVPLRLGFRLVGSDGVAPAGGAIVEVWQCDALGRYSGFPPPNGGPSARSDPGDAGGRPAPGEVGSDEFLRGRQRTDGSGTCWFHTVYPGWYPGRTVHIHVRAHANGETFTSQLYFPEHITERVFAQHPYRGRPNRDTTNSTDGIFAGGGDDAVLDVEEEADGYRASICFVLSGLVC